MGFFRAGTGFGRIFGPVFFGFTVLIAVFVGFAVLAAVFGFTVFIAVFFGFAVFVAAFFGFAFFFAIVLFSEKKLAVAPAIRSLLVEPPGTPPTRDLGRARDPGRVPDATSARAERT